jgi:membrane-associated phospholipid phosphatase
LLMELQQHQQWLKEAGWPQPLNALNFQQVLFESHLRKESMLGGGISAMPSMHVAFSILFALGLRRLSRRWYYVALVYAFVIWVGSIYFGWHYAVDGVFAVPLVLVIWKVSGRISTALIAHVHSITTPEATAQV